MPITVARFEPPADDVVRHAAERFDCVSRTAPGGAADPGEIMVRDFLRSGAYADAAAAGISTTYLALDPDVRPGRLLGYVTASSTQIRLTGGERKNSSLLTLRNADFGAVRIAMIGVDRRVQGSGIGKLLIENRSQAERDRLARVEEATGVAATSMRLDLGPDPRALLG